MSVSIRNIKVKSINEISKILIILLGIVIVINTLLNCTAEYPIYNFVDLQTQYKGYVLANKHLGITSKDLYVFELKNPVTGKIERVYVKSYLYNNVYYVGDTIKLFNY